MSDDQKKQLANAGKPLDPSTNAADMFGDPAGITGVSATVLPNDPDQNLKMPQSFPGWAAKRAEDIASEKEIPDAGAEDDVMPIESNNRSQEQTGGGVSSPIGAVIGDKTKYVTTQEAPYTTEYSLGEQDAAGGSTSDPETDDDVGEMRERVTGQPDDMEHPEELNSAAQIDRAEEMSRTE